MIFHYLVRGAIFVDGKVLLAHQIGADNTFLPGGHIELGESAELALVREIAEEIGQEAVVKRFIGAVECLWSENGQTNHEINLIFEVVVSGLNARMPPLSKEPHLEFIWSDPENLKAHNLLPAPMIECLINLGKDYCGYWGTYKE
jgi:8-oxo-dGTP diphosphatase